jgi:hypothetical protein
MSQEKVREILSHVDMTKIDLSSFRLSEKKFNELANLYRNRVVLSCVSIISCRENHDNDTVESAFQLIKKVAANPDIYHYATIYADERRAVDAAIDGITQYRNRSINDVKLKAIETRMKDAYKSMRKTIEMALENGASFKHEFDDATVERCLSIAKDPLQNNQENVQAEAEHDTVCVEPLTEHVTDETAVSSEETSIPEENDETNEEPTKAKVGFWKRLFCKV